MTWYRIDDPEHPPPKDGTPVWVWWAEHERGIEAVYSIYDDYYDGASDEFKPCWHARWGEIDSYGAADIFPTHWQPLPAPPNENETKL